MFNLCNHQHKYNQQECSQYPINPFKVEIHHTHANTIENYCCNSVQAYSFKLIVDWVIFLPEEITHKHHNEIASY